MTTTLVCWNCGESLEQLPLPISRHAHCESCFEVLHCCSMCVHYTPNQSPYCDHDLTEPPATKDTANFCEYFSPTNRFEQKDDLVLIKTRETLGSLFGEESTDSSHDDASARQTGAKTSDNPLDDLFSD